MHASKQVCLFCNHTSDLNCSQTDVIMSFLEVVWLYQSISLLLADFILNTKITQCLCRFVCAHVCVFLFPGVLTDIWTSFRPVYLHLERLRLSLGFSLLVLQMSEISCMKVWASCRLCWRFSQVCCSNISNLEGNKRFKGSLVGNYKLCPSRNFFTRNELTIYRRMFLSQWLSFV